MHLHFPWKQRANGCIHCSAISHESFNFRFPIMKNKVMNDDKLQFLFILKGFFKTMINYNKKQWKNMP